jgi:hypothetical protein
LPEILPTTSAGGPDPPDSLNVLIYIGLGMVGVGLVITFVGLGEKGFKTTELQMVGPGLVGGGGVLAILRILLCWRGCGGDTHSHLSRKGDKVGRTVSRNGLVLTLRDTEISEGVAVITE